MSYVEDRIVSFIATADLTGKEGYVVALDTSNAGQVVIGNAQTTKNIGILLVAGKAGQRVTVLLSQNGTYRAIYGGTVNIGDNLTADSSGRLITTTTAADIVQGIAKEAGAVNEYHEVIACLYRYR